MKKVFILFAMTLLIAQCGKAPTSLSKQGLAEIQVWAQIVKHVNSLAKANDTKATTWDSLVVCITSTDFDTIRKAFKFNEGDSLITCSISDVPAGKARLIEAWTKNLNNLVIHSCAGKTVDITAGEVKPVEFSLFPKRGSIYIDITDVPATIDHISAAFSFGVSETLNVTEKRSTKTYLTIDNVPDSTAGTLCITGISAAGDTLYRSSMPLVFYACQNATYSAQVTKVNTGVSLGIAALAPGATIISASMGVKKPFDIEKGPLIISEIMYAANDSEYVEVYNPLQKDTSFDTLILDIDGAYRFFTNIAVKSKGFFVFGRKNLPWVNVVHPVSSALDLSSSGGNWITIRAKDSTAMDWVAFEGSNNDQGWPNLGVAKKSIVLDSLVSDPAYNNYGKNWVAAKTPINQVNTAYSLPTTSQCGTPGAAGN
jgi:hypothetical protein